MKTEKFPLAQIRKENLKEVKGGGSYERRCPVCGSWCNVLIVDAASGACRFECPDCSYLSEIVIL